MTMAVPGHALSSVTDEDFLKEIFGADYPDAWVANYDSWTGGRAPACLSILRMDVSRYYSVGSILPGRHSRKADNLKAVHVLVLDDVGNVQQGLAPDTKVIGMSGARLDWSVVRTLTIRPSFAVETSRGNFQVGYILSTPETDIVRWRKFQKALQDAKLWPASPHGETAVHYFRLPSGLSHKAEKGFFQTRLVNWNPENRYSLDELAFHFGLFDWDEDPAMPSQPTAKPQSARAKAKRETLPTKTLIDVMTALPNDYPILDIGHDTWVALGQNFKGSAEDPNDPELVDAWVAWSSTTNAPCLGKAKDPEETWNGFPAEWTSAGTLRNQISQICAHPKPGDPNFDFREKVAKALDEVDWFPIAFTAVDAGTLPTASLNADLTDIFDRLRAARAVDPHYDRPQVVSTTFDPNTLNNVDPIPPVVMGYFARERVSFLLAVPGVGKSSLMHSTAMGLVFERPDFIGETDAGFPGDVVIISNEDETRPVFNKFRALQTHWQVQGSAAKNEVHVFEGIKALTRDPTGTITLSGKPFLEDLIKLRAKKDIALIVIDTLASITRGFEENSNDQMQIVVEFMRKLAWAAHAAVVVIHHVSKGGVDKNGEMGVYSGRGASSMAADTRSIIQVTKPNNDDKSKYQWDEAMARAWVKGSYDDPALWNDRWFKFHSIPLPAFDPRSNTQTQVSHGILVPETPVRMTAQQAFGGLQHGWELLKSALAKGPVHALKQSSKGKTVWKDVFGGSAADADRILGELIKEGIVSVHGTREREIRWDGLSEPQVLKDATNPSENEGEE
jgi:AAA domain-containing protein